jgi:hypothetical protein
LKRKPLKKNHAPPNSRVSVMLIACGYTSVTSSTGTRLVPSGPFHAYLHYASVLEAFESPVGLYWEVVEGAC